MRRKKFSRGQKVTVPPGITQGDAVIECYTRPERQVKCLYSAVLTIVPIVLYQPSDLALKRGPILGQTRTTLKRCGVMLMYCSLLMLLYENVIPYTFLCYIYFFYAIHLDESSHK